MTLTVVPTMPILFNRKGRRHVYKVCNGGHAADNPISMFKGHIWHKGKHRSFDRTLYFYNSGKQKNVNVGFHCFLTKKDALQALEVYKRELLLECTRSPRLIHNYSVYFSVIKLTDMQ